MAMCRIPGKAPHHPFHVSHRYSRRNGSGAVSLACCSAGPARRGILDNGPPEHQPDGSAPKSAEPELFVSSDASPDRIRKKRTGRRGS